MVPRTLEMIDALRKSQRKFTVSEFRQFLLDMSRADETALLRLFSPPPVAKKRATPKKKTADEFLTKIAKIQKQSGMKAADALSGLLKEVGEQDPGLGSTLTPAERKSFSSFVTALRKHWKDERVEATFRKLAQEFETEFSTKYNFDR